MALQIYFMLDNYTGVFQKKKVDILIEKCFYKLGVLPLEDIAMDPAPFDQIRHITLDCDDTIWPVGSPWPKDYRANIDTLAELIQRGNEQAFPSIGFCTGREISYMTGATRSLIAPDCWSIVENGVCLYNFATEERINHPLLTIEIREVFQEIRSRIPRIIHRFPDLQQYIGKEINIALERTNPYVKIAEYTRSIQEMLWEFSSFIEIGSSSIAVDITPKGITKGTALLELCKRLEISCRQVLAIGDSRGDFPAMEIAGYVACPSNAQEECKHLVQAKGGHISEYAYAVGVVDSIEHYLSHKNEQEETRHGQPTDTGKERS